MIKEKRINIRLSAEQFEEYGEYADKIGISVSEFIRVSAEDKIKALKDMESWGVRYGEKEETTRNA